MRPPLRLASRLSALLTLCRHLRFRGRLSLFLRRLASRTPCKSRCYPPDLIGSCRDSASRYCYFGEHFMRGVWKVLATLLFLSVPALATIFGTVRGIVHDPQHRPIVDATVTLKAKSSDYTQTLQTDAEGQFHFDAVPLGEYSVTVSQQGFVTQEQMMTVLSGTAPVLHFELRLPTQAQSVTEIGRAHV